MTLSANTLAHDHERVTRTSIGLPASELVALCGLARARGTTPSQVVRQALATELCLDAVWARGGRLLTRVGRGPLEEIWIAHLDRPAQRPASAPDGQRSRTTASAR